MTKMTIVALANQIAADGSVSTAELRQFLTATMADGTIAKDEFGAFCNMLNAVSGNPANSPALGVVACLMGSIYFLEDPTSPGVLTDAELAELNALTGADGKTDAIEARMAAFVKALSVQSGELIADLMEGDLGEDIAAIIADGTIDDAEAKSIYYRFVLDGSIDDTELAALVELNNAVGSSSALWKMIFPVLVVRAVVVDTDTNSFDISATEAKIMKDMGANGLDAHEREACEVVIELAESDESGFADWYQGLAKAA